MAVYLWGFRAGLWEMSSSEDDILAIGFSLDPTGSFFILVKGNIVIGEGYV